MFFEKSYSSMDFFEKHDLDVIRVIEQFWCRKFFF